MKASIGDRVVLRAPKKTGTPRDRRRRIRTHPDGALPRTARFRVSAGLTAPPSGYCPTLHREDHQERKGLWFYRTCLAALASLGGKAFRCATRSARPEVLTAALRTIYFVRSRPILFIHGRPTPRHHRRPRTRAGGSAADTVAAPPSARAAAVGAATRESDGDAPPAGAVPPADARGAAVGGGAGARKCWPPHRSLLRPHRDVVRHRAEDAGRSRRRSADGRRRLLVCLPLGRGGPGAERPRRARSSRRRSRQARADAHAGNRRAVCDTGRSATVRRRAHHCAHHTGRQVSPPRRAAGPHIPGVRVRLPGRAVTHGRNRRRPCRPTWRQSDQRPQAHRPCDRSDHRH